MKLAIVDGERREAQPGLSATCPGCGQAMIPKCGEQRVHHWAHRGTRACDTWWENETPWHRAWKNHFAKDQQEVWHTAENGERHVADVKTESGTVIEFQRSPLSRQERETRESFYENMVWVVDALRRVRDKPQFFASFDGGTVVKFTPFVVSLPSSACALFRDWSASCVPVFFDFGDSLLWRLNPRSPAGIAYLAPVLKSSFLEAHLKAQKLKGMGCREACLHVPALFTNITFMQPVTYSRTADGFQRYLARKERARRRF